MTKQQFPDVFSIWRVVTEQGSTDVKANFAIVVSGALSFKDATGNLVSAWAADQWQRVWLIEPDPKDF